MHKRGTTVHTGFLRAVALADGVRHGSQKLGSFLLRPSFILEILSAPPELDDTSVN